MIVALVGGFLGSGKTTAIIRACQQIIRSGEPVGVITNDQGAQQVDFLAVKHHDIPVAEVGGGCFCCNYHDLDHRLQSLVDEVKPSVIFAEAVGSCTDIVATIAKPLESGHRQMKCMVSIFVDSELMLSLIEGRASFIEESVRYIFRKQMEEADLLVLNKIDLLNEGGRQKIADALSAEYPGKQFLFQNSADASHISVWINSLNNFSDARGRKSLDVDYKIYGAGEAELSWYDEQLEISASKPVAIDAASLLVRSIFHAIQESHLMIGHLKFFIETESGSKKISLTTTSVRAINVDLPATHHVKILINARVQTSPEMLSRIIQEAVQRAQQTFSCTVDSANRSVFRPGFPNPTFRIS